MSEHVLWCTQDKIFIEQNFTNFKIYFYLYSLSESRLLVEKHCFFYKERKEVQKKRGGGDRVCFNKFEQTSFNKYQIRKHIKENYIPFKAQKSKKHELQ